MPKLDLNINENYHISPKLHQNTQFHRKLTQFKSSYI